MYYTIATASLLVLLLFLYLLCWISNITKMDWWFTRLIRRINGIQTVRNGESVAFIDLSTGLPKSADEVKILEHNFIKAIQTKLTVPIIGSICLLLGFLKLWISSI